MCAVILEFHNFTKSFFKKITKQHRGKPKNGNFKGIIFVISKRLFFLLQILKAWISRVSLSLSLNRVLCFYQIQKKKGKLFWVRWVVPVSNYRLKMIKFGFIENLIVKMKEKMSGLKSWHFFSFIQVFKYGWFVLILVCEYIK